PDHAGTWRSDRVAMGHTRLAIIDLSTSANQPMTTSDDRYTIVFNGEIYNYLDLHNALEREGDLFQSASDTEVVLLGYRKWGNTVLQRLRGMFALAIWDNLQKKLLLARDRIGVKPLFYSAVGNGLIFASEMKAIISHPEVERKINYQAVDYYLTLGYVPGPETIFKNIFALPPGFLGEWKNNALHLRRYWKPDFRAPVLRASEDDLLEELDQKLIDAVRSHLVSDVPVGVFLSGGLDSSLVAAIAQHHTGKTLSTYSIGFDAGRDERSYARAVANHIQSNHREKLISLNWVDQLPHLQWHLEQPLFDNSILPTYLVSQFASKEVKVVISGDGGDEPFCGYDWTRYSLVLPSLPEIWSPAGWHWAYQKGMRGALKKLIYDVCHGGDGRYLRRMRVSQALIHELYTDEFMNKVAKTVNQNDLLDRVLQTAPVRDRRDRFIYADFSTYLPEDILMKVDRMSMANSLEVRVPLLDHHFIKFVLALPFRMRFRHGRGKYLLRRLAARYLPPSILKPRKQGFTVPLSNWLQDDLGDKVAGLFRSKSFKERGIIRPESALKLLSLNRSNRYDLSYRIWSLVVLEAWARVWLDGEDYLQPLFYDFPHARSTRPLAGNLSAIKI
ncbi:MAG: asparagine synthase (glutamine-hydrolyzing), partial [Deltaproteobacteria bacterium]|nr:asparagine synthase (glutamine-hydrolyzing) [Deltaproteobacteria bacterium]